MCATHTQAEPIGVTRSWEAKRKQGSHSGHLDAFPESGPLGVFPNQNSRDVCCGTVWLPLPVPPGQGRQWLALQSLPWAPAVDLPFCKGYGGGGYYGLGRDHPTPSELTLLKLPRLRGSFRFLTSRNSCNLYSSPMR